MAKRKPKPKPQKPYVAYRNELAAQLRRKNPDEFAWFAYAQIAADYILSKNKGRKRVAAKNLSRKIAGFTRHEHYKPKRKKKQAPKPKQAKRPAPKPKKGKKPITPQKQKPKKKNALALINALAKRVYYRFDEFTEFRQAQQFASELLRHHDYDISTLSDADIDAAAQDWIDRNIAPPETEKPAQPEIPAEFLEEFSYWDLNEKFKELRRHAQDEAGKQQSGADKKELKSRIKEVQDALKKDKKNAVLKARLAALKEMEHTSPAPLLKDVNVSSPLSPTDFLVGDYIGDDGGVGITYAQTFQEYVNKVNEQQLPSPGILCQMMLEFSEEDNQWLILCVEIGDESGNPSGYENMYERQPRAAREVPEGKKSIKQIVGIKETAEQKAEAAGKAPVSAGEKEQMIAAQRQELKFKIDAQKALQAQFDKMIEDLAKVRDLKDAALEKQLRDDIIELRKNIAAIGRDIANLTKKIP